MSSAKNLLMEIRTKYAAERSLIMWSIKEMGSRRSTLKGRKMEYKLPTQTVLVITRAQQQCWSQAIILAPTNQLNFCHITKQARWLKTIWTQAENNLLQSCLFPGSEKKLGRQCIKVFTLFQPFSLTRGAFLYYKILCKKSSSIWADEHFWLKHYPVILIQLSWMPVLWSVFWSDAAAHIRISVVDVVWTTKHITDIPSVTKHFTAVSDTVHFSATFIKPSLLMCPISLFLYLKETPVLPPSY